MKLTSLSWFTKKNISRDTKHAVSRELSNRKLHFSFQEKRRASPVPESGRAVLDLLDPTLDHADGSRIAKGSTGVSTALNRETRLEQFQPARALWKGRANNLIPATRECSLDEFLMKIVPVYYLFSSVIFSLFTIFSSSVIYFSTPPGVCLNKKTPSHFTRRQPP